MQENHERAQEVLRLNRSVKRLTTWLVVLSMIGAGSIVAVIATGS